MNKYIDTNPPTEEELVHIRGIVEEILARAKYFVDKNICPCCEGNKLVTVTRFKRKWLFWHSHKTTKEPCNICSGTGLCTDKGRTWLTAK